MIANTPKPPYVAAIFTSIRTDVEEGSDEMDELDFKEIEILKDIWDVKHSEMKMVFA